MATNTESMYGETKRLAYFIDALRSLVRGRRARVLEIGCGTGEGLLVPLAETFRDAEFVGVDSDAASIAAGERAVAARPGIPLRFVLADGAGLPAALTSAPWDVVILSEVIEHVVDPVPLLITANRALVEGGLLLVTVPNGFGPYEIERFFWDALDMEKPFQAFRRLLGRPANPAPTTMADTNRHVGFYRWSDLVHLLNGAGFNIRSARNREWFCGPFSDLAHATLKRVKLGGALVEFTQRMAEILPRAAVADWMVSSEKAGQPAPGFRFMPPSGGFRGWWWKTKRRHSGRPG